MSIKREWITPITAGSFLLLAVTGVFMFFHAAPEMAKEMHEWLSWIFLAAIAFHAMANFSALKNYLFQRKGQALFGAFVLILLVSFAPFGGDEEGGEHPLAAPVRALAHAPLSTVAQVAQTSPEEILSRLKQEGLAVQSAQQSLNDLVGDDMHKQAHFLQVVLKK